MIEIDAETISRNQTENFRRTEYNRYQGVSIFDVTSMDSSLCDTLALERPYLRR